MNTRDERERGSRLFGKTSEVDYLRWQRRAVTALTAILDDAHRAGYPALSWTITRFGGLHGRVDSFASPADQRAAFDVWATYLGVRRWPDRSRSDAWVHLHAVGTLLDVLDLQVAVALTADIEPDNPADTDRGTSTVTGEEC